MDSPAQVDPASLTAARHRAEIPTLRRWSRLLLIAGTLASLGCALGPLWLVRLGLIPAIGAALAACLLTWREMTLERRAHAAAMLAGSRRHGEQLSDERRHNAAVVGALSRRLHASTTLATSRAATINRLHGDIRRLQGDVNGLRGANSRLTRDLNFRDRTIAELRETMREAALSAARAGASGEPDETKRSTAELHALPRRPLRDEIDIDCSEHRTAAFLIAQSPITLPNYEDDRRFA
jgi:hypothetical protein